MRCREWNRIQLALDGEIEFSEGLIDHIRRCRYCSSRLDAYYRFLSVYRRESENPAVCKRKKIQKTGNLSARAAAAVLIFVGTVAYMGLGGLRHAQEGDLKRSYTKDLVDSVIQGELLDEGSNFFPMYEGDWFKEEPDRF